MKDIFGQKVSFIDFWSALMFQKFGLTFFLLACFVFSADMTATLSNGAAVVLHDNGRWEYYNNNSKVRDIRESAIPEDVKLVVTVEYEGLEKLKKDMRMRMEADFATEEEIKDSLRTLPKGGIVHFCAPTKQIHKGDAARMFTYTIWVGKKQVYQDTFSESTAVASETAGVSDLLSVPLYAGIKGEKISARVSEKTGKRSIDFEIK